VSLQAVFDQDFALICDLVGGHGRRRPAHPALIQDDITLTYGELNARMDRVAAALQRDGCAPGSSIAILSGTLIDYAVVFLGALRAGVAVAPLAPSSTPDSLLAMANDAGAGLLFIDSASASALAGRLPEIMARAIRLDTPEFEAWLEPAGASPAPVAIGPDDPFNIIYSSGTTGIPKGIVQPHGMRWGHVQRASHYGYGPDSVTLLSTPLYSNTTLVSFFPTLTMGGTVVLMAKFDPLAYLELAQRHRVTHTMLVPVQYSRLMRHPDFDRYDLSSFVAKSCTSAPFAAALKAEILRRWPGMLLEVYGMTEGGGACILAAHAHPDKLHTVGQPVAGHDIRVIGEHGEELPVGETGEVVGHSRAMMKGYHNQPAKTAEAEWFDASGRRFIRTGDLGRFDADGFLTLLDRRKDMIISGGFNIYPSDLEAVLRQHADVADVAVVGLPSERWGETPVAFVVPRAGAAIAAATLLAFANERLGRTQRLAAVEFLAELPRSAIGKVLKRELRDSYGRTLP